MFSLKRGEKREFIGSQVEEILELPSLIEIQLNSYENFLQLEKVRNGEPLERKGLEEVFQSVFPIESSTGELVLEYEGYSVAFDSSNFDVEKCKRKGLTYSVSIKATINLVFQNTGEIRQKDVYIGDIPLMTNRGTFIINGAERVIVSQIHRSPGVVFAREKGVLSSRIIPSRGSWLEFEVDSKKELLNVKIDRKKKILGTIFLRALGLNTREKIIKAFYKSKKQKLLKKQQSNESLIGSFFAKSVYIENEGEKQKLFSAGEKIHVHHLDELLHAGVSDVSVVDFNAEKSLGSPLILNCFDREGALFSKESPEKDEPSQLESVLYILSILSPGDAIITDDTENNIINMFFSSSRYNLGEVGRYKLNKKFGRDDDYGDATLSLEDVVETMNHLLRIYIDEVEMDDIDHLGNRRVRSAGELVSNVLKSAFLRFEKTARERMTIKEFDALRPQDIISVKPVVSAIKEFFGSSQLSQFMDQVNPLAELTHKRRLSALGPGGLARDRAGMDVRDVHYSHYSRMCPIETPEGPNIGLIVSLANYARVNKYGFIEAPYRKVVNKKITDKIVYLSAIDEDRYNIAPSGTPLTESGEFVHETVEVRKGGDYTIKLADEVSYMDVSPLQTISAAASLIPFLEHDDANRALMGCNMQRQAVPLLYAEPPLVGTGMERRVASDSGVTIGAKRDGVVSYVTAEKIVITPQSGSDKNDVDEYNLIKFQRTNQDTYFNQRPTVRVGESVKAGDIITDGPSTSGGDLSLGSNLLVAFMPWNGYNFEDAILVSEKVVREDRYTSIHIKEFSIEIRETKLGAERLTADIPNASEQAKQHLDEEGIVFVGARVKAGSILVGKVTPRSDTETTPEFRLLNSIFGEKAKEVRDTSLRLPHGVEGIVIDVQRLRRSEGDDLNPGVEEVIKILLATKRNLRAGDKMAGRHGNKGVVARILPEEDMPFMEDGTTVDICLNPLGVPSRMNIGQIMETALGFAGARLGKFYETPVFMSASNEEIEGELKKAGIPSSSKVPLFNGLTGEAFENPVLVGYMYYLKLHHLVDDKMHARSTGPYSLVTQQPLGGKAQFGGQRLGEMEVWALYAYGAANTLQEFMTIKSDDMVGRSKIYESIVKGNAATFLGIPESFNVLIQELRGLALDVTVYDSKGKPLPLTERDEDIINKTESQF